MINRLLRPFGLRLARLRPDPKLWLYPDSGLFLNVGAGKWHHPRWTNVDNPRADYSKSLAAQMPHDLMSGAPMPVGDSSVDLIFTSHTIEHLNDRAVTRFLADAYRALKPGGILRITCPDIAIYVAAYRRGDRRFFIETLNGQDLPYSNEQILLYSFAGPLSAFHKGNELPKVSDSGLENLDQFTDRIPDAIAAKYPRDHKAWFTVPKLLAMLGAAGFTAHESRYGQSVSPIMRDTHFFDTTHPVLSLYVEGVKH